jgi:predicted peptidase
MRAAVAILALAFALQPQIDRRFVRRTHAGRPYRLFIPKETRHAQPLVLFLHGGAGRGADNSRQLTEGNGMLANMFVREDAYVLAPQTRNEHDAKTTLAILDEVMKRHRIDRNRVYVVGQSLGGYGAIDVLAAAPERFAAGVIVAAGDGGRDAKKLARVPLWFFHGERDETIDVAQPRALVAKIKAAGGKVKYTEYAGQEHGLAWLVVKDRTLAPWLFAQRRR